MSIVRRPRQFTLLASLILGAVPVFALNLWVMQKGPILKILTVEHRTWVIVQAVWCLITFRWLLQARWRGFWSFVAMSGVLLAGNIYFLLATKNYALAFYALFLLILAGVYAIHLFRSLREAYYHSGQSWYEGRPVFLPRIEAELKLKERAVSARLSRLGEEGCYAFAAPNADALPKNEKVEGIVLKLGDLSLDCAVELVSQTKDGVGHGLRFVAGSADKKKDILDFIDRVRCSGYVA